MATLRSLRCVIRDKTAHCIEGALAAAAILSHHGHAPHIACIEARDIDHIVCLYQRDEKWGSVAHSRDVNLKDRDPIFTTIRDLIMSYYPYYWNMFTGDLNDLTPRGFTTLDLQQCDRDWVATEDDLWFIEDELYAARYEALFPEQDRTHFLSNRDGTITWIE